MKSRFSRRSVVSRFAGISGSLVSSFFLGPPVGAQGPVFERIHAFDYPPCFDSVHLTVASDGSVYGTTGLGGSHGHGAILKIDPSGNVSVPINFSGPDGVSPVCWLVEGPDGNLYGTTTDGGNTTGSGTIFRLTPGGVLTTLHEFSGPDGSSPDLRMAVDDTGSLYGMTYGGGLNSFGTIFKLSHAGVLTTLYHLDLTSGVGPIGGVIRGLDGAFYGNTPAGGANGFGTALRFDSTGNVQVMTNYTNLTSYTGFGLMQEASGDFFGVGGLTIFRIAKNPPPSNSWTLTRALQGGGGVFPIMGSKGLFCTYAHEVVGDDWRIFRINEFEVRETVTLFEDTQVRPGIGLLSQGADGTIVGGTNGGGRRSVNGKVHKFLPNGTLSEIASFPNLNGLDPRSEMLLASDGNFYGTTEFGGEFGSGTVFRMTPGGSVETLVSFHYDTPVGSEPLVALVEGDDGFLYGSTSNYGEDSTSGTVFKMKKSGEVTVLANFGAEAELLKGADGNFYGVDHRGGEEEEGCVFKMTPSGDVSILASFDGENGSEPVGGLFRDIDGNLYGTTRAGGEGFGNIFKVTPAGVITSLQDFTYFNGYYPTSRLTLGSDGNLYGTCEGGGSMAGGVVFKISLEGDYEVVASFPWNEGTPRGGVIEGPDGNFYGTLSGSIAPDDYGDFELGKVYRLSPSGAVTIVESFDGPNGRYPTSGLCRGSDGNLYGTTARGGSSPDGVPAGGGQIYRLRFGVGGVETFADWTEDSGLEGASAGPSAIPHGDGIVNLLKYAFNLDGSGPDARVLEPGTGVAGLPAFSFEKSGAQSYLVVEYLRRKGSGLVYVPKVSTTLAPGSFVPMSGTPLVTPVDAAWERVLVKEPRDLLASPKAFGIVEVTGP